MSRRLNATDAAANERCDSDLKIQDDAHAKLSISSWEQTACAKVAEFIRGCARYSHQVVVMAEDRDGFLMHFNGAPVRVRIEPLVGAEREALVFGARISDRGQEALDAAGHFNSPPSGPAAINSAVTA